MSVNMAEMGQFRGGNWNPDNIARSFVRETQTTGKTMATSTTKRSSASTTTPRKTPSRAKPKAGLETEIKVAKSDTVKPIASEATPEPTLVEANGAVEDLPMRKKELIDLVVEQSGIKKKDAKPVVEAMLAVLGEAVGNGRELNLQPLGKLRINRSVERSNGRIIICKLRQSTAMIENSPETDDSASAPLAEDIG